MAQDMYKVKTVESFGNYDEDRYCYVAFGCPDLYFDIQNGIFVCSSRGRKFDDPKRCLKCTKLQKIISRSHNIDMRWIDA